MAYSAPLIGFPHYHRNHASTPDIKERSGAETPPLPIHNTTTLAQRANHLREREGFVQTIVLMDSDTLTAGAGEGSNLLAAYGAEDILVPIDRIQERNFAPIALVRKINHCLIPHFQRL